MANKKLTDLTELTTPADGDFLYIVDVSDTTESAQGTSKKIRKSNITPIISGKEDVSNKQNSLAIDGTGTKYPTVDAVNAGLPANYFKIVYVNATSPTTATIFDTENPPVTNDNLLKNDVANLYIGTDASTWVYNSSTYVTKTVTATSSNFYLAGTTTDAGNTKTGHITRSGAVTLTGSLNMAIAKISTTPNTSAGSYDILTRNSSTTALEKKLVSDFVQTTSDQSITGRKYLASTNTVEGGIQIDNSRTSTRPEALRIYNNGTTGILVESTVGDGAFLKSLGSGNGITVQNFSTGTGVTLRNQGGTGDLLYAELGKVTISSSGKLSTTEAPTVGNNVTNKTYVDGKITQTITNGVTDKSPSEDAVFYAIDGVVNNIPFNIIGDDIKNNNTGRLLIGDGTHTVDDSAVLINRDLTTGGTSLGFHAIRDETLYNTNDVTGLRAYASFDAIPKMQGTALFNHLHSFQSRPNYSGSSLISALRGFTHQPTITGPVDLHQAIFIDDFLGAGTVNQNVGLYIKPLLKGVSNYAIFSEGIAPSFFGGTLQTNGLVQGATAKFTSYSGTFGSFTTFDSSGNLMNNPNLTLINGVLSMKFSTAKIKSTVTALELESLTNLIFLTAGIEKARIATNGNFLLGSSADNGASDKLQVTGTLATTSTIKAGATVRLKNYTVATLPTGVQGDTAYVTDALAPTYLGALVGGGAVVTPVFYNGTAWVSH